MTSQQKTIDFIVGRIAKAGSVSARKMFGEYTIYCDGKVVALVCDDRLFVKPTDAGRKHIGDVEEAPPYKGAKPCFIVAEDYWDDRAWMTKLFKLTTAELPEPKPKKPGKTK